MKLDFKVLWFDNDLDYFDSQSRYFSALESEIASWGFSPNIKKVTSKDDFLSFSPFKDFDLIVVDHNLDEYGHGEDFIKMIRSHDVHTEVIFYTGGDVTALWNAMFEKRIDGVYVAHRPQIFTKIEAVAKQAVKKVLDLENMRGIVMAAVADFDHMLDELIISVFNRLPSDETKKKIKEEIVEISTKYHRVELDKASKIDANQPIEIFSSLLTSNPKHIVLRKMLSELNSNDLNIISKEIDQYTVDIIEHRNNLGHAMEKEHKDGTYILVSKKKKIPIEYDHSLFQTLRHNLIRYRQAFERLGAYLK